MNFVRNTKGFTTNATITLSSSAGFDATDHSADKRSVWIPCSAVGAKGLGKGDIVNLMVHASRAQYNGGAELTATAVRSVTKFEPPTMSGVITNLRVSHDRRTVMFAFFEGDIMPGRKASVFIPGRLVPHELVQGSTCTVEYKEAEHKGKKGYEALTVIEVKAPPVYERAQAKPAHAASKAVTPLPSAVESTKVKPQSLRAKVTLWSGYGFAMTDTDERIYLPEELVAHPKAVDVGIKPGDDLLLEVVRNKQGLKAVKIDKVFRATMQAA
jgi:hypothetical protein